MIGDTRLVPARSSRAMVPAPASLLGRLGSWSYRHRRLVAAGWLVALVLVTLAAGPRALSSRTT